MLKLSAFSHIVIPELNQDIISLNCIRDMEIQDGKWVINLVLPTFALKSEAEIAAAVKQAAYLSKADDLDVTLNVFAEVKPATTQSLNKAGVSDVKNIILVASGKGGVGKSTVAANLAVALAGLGCRVGLLDADVYGPSVPMMFGIPEDVEIKGVRTDQSEETFMIPVEKNGLKLMSIGFLVDTNAAMIWRGPMIASASMQMFFNVAWGDLDYLIVDMPPGTGDIQLTISQRVNVAGAVIVSTPQDMALADVVRAKAMFDKVNVPSLGLVENMSYFVCDGCDKRHEIFTHGGAKKVAERLGLPFLAEIPINTKIRAAADEGVPMSLPEFQELAYNVAARIALAAMTPDASGTPSISISGKRGLPVLSN